MKMEFEKKDGTIRFIHQKKTATGSTMYTFEMADGQKYNCFNHDFASQFKIGDDVILFGIQEGKFWNMKDMKKAEKPVVEKIETPKSVSYDREKIIIAQTLTKCYAEIMATNQFPGEEIMKSVLKAYNYFLENLEKKQ